jgi:gamma-glutamylcyclotransferase (GGCT)/AIG2-like uncharacterized protein YtfP
MPLLFSYGTLQEDAVQLATFGRRLAGQPDELPGFERARVPITDPRVIESTGRTHHENVVFSGRPDSAVPGTVFDVSEADLAVADEFERAASYLRIAATLRSGKRAWLYIDAGSVHEVPLP